MPVFLKTNSFHYNINRYNYIEPVNDIINEIMLLDVPEQYKLSDNRTKAIIKIIKKRKFG